VLCHCTVCGHLAAAITVMINARQQQATVCMSDQRK